jgi:DNA-directed RNA polymerase specialized sigma24 family protein
MDHDLVLRAQRGDQRAFETLTVACHSRLYKAAHGILRDRHLAEDATQQAFIDIWPGGGCGSLVSARRQSLLLRPRHQ